MVELINNETLSILLLAPIFIILLYKWFSTSNSPTTNSPPSPFKLPIIGNLHQLGLLASPRPPLHRSLQALAHVHGPLMLLHFGNVPVLVISSAEAAHTIMKTHDLASCSRPKVTVFDKLLYDSQDVAAAPYGEYWKNIKSLCVLHLLSTKRVRSYRGIREEETKAMIKNIRESSSSKGDVISLRKMLMTLTNNVVSRVALGKSYYSDEAFKKLSMEHTELLGSLYIGDYVPWLSWLSRFGLDMKLDNIAKKFDEFLEMVIQEHIEHTQNSNDQNKKEEMDFVDVLLQIQRENSTVFPSGDRNGIKGILLDMFLAGTDTIAAVLEWAMSEILRHPNVMKKLQDEIRSVTKGEDDILTEDDLVDMHYLKAVINESLRLHPPLALLFPRILTQDVTIERYTIKANTQVIVNAWQVCRDPKAYDNYKANDFEPERFMGVDKGVNYLGNDFKFIPFGAGRRICPAIQFAAAVVEIALVNLLHKFDWRSAGGVRSEDLDMTELAGLTSHRKIPLEAVAIIPCL